MTKQIKLDYFYANNYGLTSDDFNDVDIYCGDDRRVYIRLNTDDDLSEKLYDGTAIANDYSWEWIVSDTPRAVSRWANSTAANQPGSVAAEKFNRENHG